MQTSATGTESAMPHSLAPIDCLAGRPHARARSGFSLVEVLVTLSVSALAATLIMATARPSDPLRTDGEQLTSMLERLDRRARITGSPTGLVIEADRYTGVAWTGAEWSNLPRQSRGLSRGVTFKITPSTGAKDEKQLSPQLIFYPLGHSSSEPLVLLSNGRNLTVSLSATSPLSAQ